MLLLQPVHQFLCDPPVIVLSCILDGNIRIKILYVQLYSYIKAQNFLCPHQNYFTGLCKILQIQNTKSMLTNLQLYTSYLPFRVNNLITILIHFLHCNATTIHTFHPHTATKTTVCCCVVCISHMC